MSDSMEVAVIGGGVMGLATAWELARRGLKPVAVSYTHLTLPTNREV